MNSLIFATIISSAVVAVNAVQYDDNEDSEFKIIRLNKENRGWDITLTAMTWPESYQFCRRRNMSLMSLSTPEDSAYVNGIMELLGLDPKDAQLWISGTDWLNEGNFTWMSTGEEVNHDNWLPGQPDGAKQENCMALVDGRKNDGYGWEDRHCNEKLWPLCLIGSVED